MKKEPPLKFTTDGCSGGMSWAWRKLFKKAPPWEGACVEHDRAYWKGGTAEQRKAADMKLAREVASSGRRIIGLAMYYGVRMGGVPWLPTSWRWGYGYGRKFGNYKEGQ